MRTCAFMPIALAEYENNRISNPVDEMIEDTYTQVCIDNLNQELENANLSEFKLNKFNIEDAASFSLRITNAMRDQVVNKNVQV